MTLIPSLEVTDKKMLRLQREKLVANEHQERKHKDWNDNYELYRNKVRTNRLTQRQAVNIPLMKETIKTILSGIDDVPKIDWKEMSGDGLKELIYQEIWNAQSRREKFDWIDLVDKKNVLMYGLSTKMLNPTEEGVCIDVMDAWDIVYDPLMNPLDIESARFIIRKNIFRSLREIIADDRYTDKGKKELKLWADTEDALVQSNNNKEEANRRNKRLESMGVGSDEFDTFSAGDVVVNLTEHYTREWNTKTQEFEKHVVVYADDWMELSDDTLKDLIGIDEYPFVVWYEDPETNDVYPDSVADLVRTPNQIMNVWFSQLVENRTLQNFQMHWFDATKKGYTPQTYEPGPGRMLPAPGNPKETILPVEINGLDESLTAIEFLTRIVERGSGAVSVNKGVSEETTQTLGEVEILLGSAKERSVAMQKFYQGSWYELAVKWNKMMHANPPGQTTLYRTGRSGKVYSKKVKAEDWKGEYEPIVTSSSEQEANQVKNIQKFQFVQQQSPNNAVLRKIALRRNLEILDMTPGELKEVEDEETRLQEQMERQQMMAQQQAQQPQQPQQQPQMMQPQMEEDPETQQLLGELATL